jgi:RNase P subunit RPR2
MKERDEQVSIDPNRNRIFVPGTGDQPMVGLDRAKLDAASKRQLRENVQLQRMMRSTWRCVTSEGCRQEWPGTAVRVRKMEEQVVMVCPECGGPVVVVKDALSLTERF